MPPRARSTIPGGGIPRLKSWEDVKETLVETLEQFETQDAERIINKLEEIEDFPDHFFDRLKNHPGYKLRIGDFRVLIDWDKDNETLYGSDAFERKNEYRELGKYREVWGSWREDMER